MNDNILTVNLHIAETPDVQYETQKQAFYAASADVDAPLSPNWWQTDSLDLSPVREQDQTPASYIIWGRKSSEQCSVGNHFDAFCEVWRGKTGAVRGKHKLIVFVKLNIHRATALFKFLSVQLFQSSNDDPWRL